MKEILGKSYGFVEIAPLRENSSEMTQISNTEVRRQCNVARSLFALDGVVFSDAEFEAATSVAVEQNRLDPGALSREILRLEAGWHQLVNQ